MMDWTDTHCRVFHRILSRHTLLYTEMVTAPALVRGGARHLLAFDDCEHPVALQLGGSDAKELAAAAKMGAEAGYDRIDLNCGCPSDRVQSGTFGAVLMRSPDLVAEAVAEMIHAQSRPVSVKCRIGVDDQDPEIVLPDFLSKIAAAGVKDVTIHARKAWLQGLSPKENRTVPPLDYALVHRMKPAFPGLQLTINGGIETLDEVEDQLTVMDGVMVGRAAYHRPADILLDADRRIFGSSAPPLTRSEAVEAMIPYVERHIAGGGRLHQVSRHMLGLFAGLPGARQWRRILSEGAHRTGADAGLLRDAMGAVEQARAA
ncbi:tRNA dihydrouridine(20/20a) synthase DusA [Palleronia abyssalis]|uniref:tRNA-dihydrouridine(20/20a) synthase n=1 Tax=Palleronia abyssalis TaxID=1501240 RepID=A0A2R8BQP2_9RHOB|nr:tRNA dihydrouridine(20/20a) synthase DusA [Palleronia abyssalis]SPJ22477.1 tRNA-dihydrouridine(20/20a) synthase [Palleronia abyssalis]